MLLTTKLNFKIQNTTQIRKLLVTRTSTVSIKVKLTLQRMIECGCFSYCYL